MLGDSTRLAQSVDEFLCHPLSIEVAGIYDDILIVMALVDHTWSDIWQDCISILGGRMVLPSRRVDVLLGLGSGVFVGTLSVNDTAGGDDVGIATVV